MKPITKSSLSTAVVEKIVDAIKRGNFKPGDKLPSMYKLSEELKVGHSSIREGLKQLQSTGLIEIKQGKGTFISERININSLSRNIGHLLILQKPDIFYLIETRMIIERGTVRLATKRASKDDIKKLSRIIQNMEANLNNLENFVEEDMSFHLKIAEFSENPILPIFFNSIRGLFLKEVEAVVRLSGGRERAINYPKKIYMAIKDRHSDRAIKAMIDHLTDIEKAISKYLNKNLKDNP